MPPTTPDECYELSPFGFGPFPAPGETVPGCPPHPHGSGFGGVGFLPTQQEGGSPYGLGSYGSTWFSRPRVNIDGGYGGDPYGLGPYGAEKQPPSVASAISLNGFEVEVFFSEELDPRNVALTDPTAYQIDAVVGAPVSVVGAHIEKLGTVNVRAGSTMKGVLSVVLQHTGTTLGGTYTVTATRLTDVAGNALTGAAANFLARGEPPQYVASLPVPDTGDAILLTFDQPMLPVAEYPVIVGGSTIESPASYVFEPDETNPYPITAVVQSATLRSAREVLLKVKGMTSLVYDVTVGPALAFDYDGSVLPLAAGGFDAVELGTGSSSVVGGHLVLTRKKNLSYGWEFLDTSGHIVPSTSTFRADADFDFSTASFDPVLSLFPAPEIAEFVVQDGVPGNGVLVRLTLQKGIGGADQIRVRSGSYDQTFDMAWSNARHTLSVVRNMKAGVYTILLDEHPVISTLVANFDALPDNEPGARWGLLTGGWDANGVRLHGVRFTASTTVFSNAWNFLHHAPGNLLGSDVLTRDKLLTQRGPLVKGWGDATPATVQDVEVYVAGVAVDVAEVNPYIGEVTTTIPIPLLPLGDPQADVKVDYKWFATPVMTLNGLNTPGLVLNKFDCKSGHHDPPAHGEQNQVPPGPNVLLDPGKPKGAPDIHRFPMGVVLGPLVRRKPVYIGHRYMGFERAYSALTNSPTTMLLNQAPGRTSVPGFAREVSGVSAAYEGLVKPGESSPPWVLDGTDTGGVDHGVGTLTVIDAQSGAFVPDDPQGAVYRRGVDLTFPSAVTLVARFRVVEFESDGVFTGVGFGIHDNRRLYFAGALRVNGAEHVGLLLNPARPHEVTSWVVGPKAILTARSQTRGSFVTSQVPVGFTTGSRFQMLSGSQTGVYTASLVVPQSDGTTTVDFTPALPAPWDQYGNKYPEAVFETRFSTKAFSYRLEIDTDQQVAELRTSGETRGLVATIDGNTPALPTPSSTSLLLSSGGLGQVFWGSLSWKATSKSTWSFFRYGVTPDQVFLSGHAVVVNTEMSDLPENDPHKEWFPTETFGYSEIESSTDRMLLKATSEHSSLGLSFGYARTEPFFTPDSIFDLRAKFRMDTGTLGAGDVQVELDDTQRLVRLVTLLFREGYGPDTTFRRLIRLPAVSMAGFALPETLGWGSSVGSTLTASPVGAQLVTTQVSKAGGGYAKNLELVGLVDEGRVLEARLAVTSSTANANGDTGIELGCQMPALLAGFAVVRVELRGGALPGVRILSAAGVPIGEYTFDWTDGKPHTYRLQANKTTNSVTLVIDDQVQLPALAFAPFDGGINATEVFFGAYGTDKDGLTDAALTSTVEWHSVSCHQVAPSDAKRTLGVWLGGDLDDINSYEIPRTDTSSAPNSWAVGPTIEAMDWRDDTEVRVYRDPGWGVTVFRPDLPVPPYYQPEQAGVAGTGFITESTQPSLGWINVEYRNLPKSSGVSLGVARFGALDSRSVSQQRWDWVRYRLFRHPTEDRIAPLHMVLNQFNVITSGEMTQDTGLERVVIQTMDPTRLSLLPVHMYAESVYKVIDGSTVYTSEDWVFDAASQTLTLQPDPDTGDAKFFSGAQAAVTVMFVPGKPVTNTYLLKQALLDSVTKLNEGTPPVPKSQTADSIVEIASGVQINDPDDVINNLAFVLNDPHQVIQHKNVEGSLYEALSFMEVDDGGQEGLIASICEGHLPEGFSGLAADEGEDVYSPSGAGEDLGGTGASTGHKTTGAKVGKAVGAHVLDFKGTQFWQEVLTPPEPDWTQKGGMPGGVLFASGGAFVGPAVDANGNIIANNLPLGGKVGPGSAVLMPTFPAKGPHGGPQGRIYQRTDWFMRLNSVLCAAPSTSTGRSVGESVGGSVGESVGGSVGGSVGAEVEECPLDEDMVLDRLDQTAASLPFYWAVNPNGQTHANGIAVGWLIGIGDFSRIGPWGGQAALEPALDSGRVEFETPIPDGASFELREETFGLVITFTARNVPVLPTEFATGPAPHSSLAAVINTHPVAKNLVRAYAGLTLSGKLMTRIDARQPVATGNMLALKSLSMAFLRVTGTQAGPGGVGFLTGGAKVTQSSMLAGGTRTLNENGDHDPKRGMVCHGGSTLPGGSEVQVVFQSA